MQRRVGRSSGRGWSAHRVVVTCLLLAGLVLSVGVAHADELPDPVVRRVPRPAPAAPNPLLPPPSERGGGTAPEAPAGTSKDLGPPMDSMPGVIPDVPPPGSRPPLDGRPGREGIGLGDRPPSRPSEERTPEPGSTLFEVDQGGHGTVETFEKDADTTAYVMMGNPRLQQLPRTGPDGKRIPGFEIKGHLFVVWVRKGAFQQMDAFQGKANDASGTAEGADGRTSASVIPEDIQEIYAEGAVELTYDDVVFRADRLYLDPHRFAAWFVRPRFDGHVSGRAVGTRRVPIHVRARRAIQTGPGRIVFLEGEASTSRAADRIAFVTQELVVEDVPESAPPPEEAPAGPRKQLLGFHPDNVQQYTARRIQVRGERLPLFYWPELSFGFSTQGGDPVPSLFQGIDVGRRDHLGIFGFVRVGGNLGPPKAPVAAWSARAGGYVDRGPALGGTLSWDRLDATEGLRSKGTTEVFGVWQIIDIDDRSGFDPPNDLRWRVLHESRTRLARRLHLDAEFNAFSDRGFNPEFFERDHLEHKDRESYLRLYGNPARPGWLVGTLTGKWHQRNFVTETVLAPQAGLWVLGAPLLVPRRRGGLGIDVTSHSDAGWLGRRFDDALPDAAYDAWRFHTDTRLNLASTVGDVRLSGHVGVVADRYSGRTDGGQDLTRTALVAGALANLQLWRTYAASGGPFQLWGLRHVMDLDAGFEMRDRESHAITEVPFFDRVEQTRNHLAAVARLRNRFQTRARDGALRNVLDLEAAFLRYANDRSPYGADTPGVLEFQADAILNERLDAQGQLTVDLEHGTQTGSLGVGWRSGQGVGRLTAFAGLGYIRDLSETLSGELGWRFSEKYGLRAQYVRDILRDITVYRFVFRRYSPDHVIEFGLRLRDGEVGLEVDLLPAIGGVPRSNDRVFDDEPLLNNLGTTVRPEDAGSGRP